MPDAIREELWITDIPRLERTLDVARELQQQGYAIHLEEQSMRDIVSFYRTGSQEAATGPTKGRCTIGDTNVFLRNGGVCLCPVMPPLARFGKEGTLKELWQSADAKQMRRRIRRCRRHCTMSCVRPNSLTHKAKLFLRMT